MLQASGQRVRTLGHCDGHRPWLDTQSAVDDMAQKLPREEYRRYGNPSERVTERKLAALKSRHSHSHSAFGVRA